MISIAQGLVQIIHSRPFLTESLTDGIINLSSLARIIKDDLEFIVKKEVSVPAIIMALKRMPFSSTDKPSKKMKVLLSNLGNITVRSNLSEYTFLNTESLVSKQKQLLNKADKRKDSFYTFSSGVSETTIVTGNISEKEMNAIFINEKLLNKKHTLSSITILLPAGNQEMPGLYYLFFKNLAWKGITVIEVISTTHEITVLINEKDTSAAFDVFRNIQ